MTKYRSGEALKYIVMDLEAHPDSTKYEIAHRLGMSAQTVYNNWDKVQMVLSGTPIETFTKNFVEPGKKFNRLTVVEMAGQGKQREYLWKCRCECGREVTVSTVDLTSGARKQCAPWNHNLLGKKYGKLTILDYDHTDNFGLACFRCKCDCGNETIVPGSSIVKGNTRSCGCGEYKSGCENVKKHHIESHVDGTNLDVIKGKVRSDNTSGITGVSYYKSRDKWVARINFRGKNYNLGYYDKIEDAAEARREAEEVLFDPMLEAHGKSPISEAEYERRLYEAVHGENAQKREKKFGQ